MIISTADLPKGRQVVKEDIPKIIKRRKAIEAAENKVKEDEMKEAQLNQDKKKQEFKSQLKEELLVDITEIIKKSFSEMKEDILKEQAESIKKALKKSNKELRILNQG